jgi:hypothetical protein
VDVWSGQTWSWIAEHSLAEPRYGIGAVTLEVELWEGRRPVALFAGGAGPGGSDSVKVDMYDYVAQRWLPIMELPTVRGPTRALHLGSDAALFLSDNGEMDVFNGTSLCWISFKMEGASHASEAVGYPGQWFLNYTADSAPHGTTGRIAAVAYVAGGYAPSGASTTMSYVFTWERGSDCTSADAVSLTSVSHTCGVMGAGNVMGGFSDAWDPMQPRGAPPSERKEPPAPPAPDVHDQAGEVDVPLPPHKKTIIWWHVLLYIIAIGAALSLSYFITWVCITSQPLTFSWGRLTCGYTPIAESNKREESGYPMRNKVRRHPESA